jgi:uncharacterized membrane protein YidH (DUF202 family)
MTIAWIRTALAFAGRTIALTTVAAEAETETAAREL